MAHREDPWWATEPDEKPVSLVPGAGLLAPENDAPARYESLERRERQMLRPLPESEVDAAANAHRSARRRRVASTAIPWPAGGRLTPKAEVVGAALVVLVVGCVQMFGAGWRYGSAVAERLSSTSSTTAVADSPQETVTSITSMVHMEESRSRRRLQDDLGRSRKREVRRQR